MKQFSDLPISNTRRSSRLCTAAVVILLMTAQSRAFAQTARAATSASEARADSRTPELLSEFNTSLVTLTKKVMPAVVQIVVTSYGPVEAASHSGSVALFARQHDIGSGVVVSSDGYIATNAHVVEGAQRIRVVLPVAQDAENPGARKVLDAKLVGADKQIDLALLKVEAHDLPVLKLAGSRPVYPGEL